MGKKPHGTWVKYQYKAAQSRLQPWEDSSRSPKMVFQAWIAGATLWSANRACVDLGLDNAEGN